MRFLTAIMGGLTLVVPMLIMAIRPLREKTSPQALPYFCSPLVLRGNRQRSDKKY